MEIFNKDSNSGYEEIVSYGPSWWTEYREMDAVYQYEGWLLDLMYHLLERTVLNQFPSQADEATIAIFEKLLKIEHDAEATLEERRRMVQIYYSGIGHLSKSVIEGLIKTYTGHDGNVYFEDGVLIVEFNNNDAISVSLGVLQKAIERRLPAHLTYQARCTCTVFLGIKPATEAWKKAFTLTGTVPGVSTGLSIARGGIEVETAAEGFQTVYPVSGASGNAGTYPVTSTGLSVADSSGLVGVNTESYSTLYKMCGDDSGL